MNRRNGPCALHASSRFDGASISVCRPRTRAWVKRTRCPVARSGITQCKNRCETRARRKKKKHRESEGQRQKTSVHNKSVLALGNVCAHAHISQGSRAFLFAMPFSSTGSKALRFGLLVRPDQMTLSAWHTPNSMFICMENCAIYFFYQSEKDRKLFFFFCSAEIAKNGLECLGGMGNMLFDFTVNANSSIAESLKSDCPWRICGTWSVLSEH